MKPNGSSAAVMMCSWLIIESPPNCHILSVKYSLWRKKFRLLWTSVEATGRRYSAKRWNQPRCSCRRASAPDCWLGTPEWPVMRSSRISSWHATTWQNCCPRDGSPSRRSISRRTTRLPCRSSTPSRCMIATSDASFSRGAILKLMASRPAGCCGHRA